MNRHRRRSPPLRPDRGHMRESIPQLISHVIVLAPYIEVQGELVSPHYDLPAYREEIGGWMQALGLTWEWQPVTARALPQILAAARNAMRTRKLLVFNLCDGSDSDGYPGGEVIQQLEAHGIPYTGASERFYQLTTSKSDSKKSFMAHGVQTAPFVMIADPDTDLPRAIADIGLPLFIKPDVSAGSYGIQIDSVCYDLAAAKNKVAQLKLGMHGQIFGQTFGRAAIMAEQFIEGREFTVLVVEDASQPMGLWVLPPGERVFDKRVPPRERFLAFERYWGMPEAQRPIPESDPYYWYALAPPELRTELEDLARRAMRAAGGAGYARIDIRLDEKSGRLNVLEVNAQCGLSSDDSSTVGSMLALSGEKITDLIARVLRHGIERSRSPDPDRTESAGQLTSPP